MSSAPGTFDLSAGGPFRLDLTVWTLRRRAHNEMDLWDPQTRIYERSLMIDGSPIPLRVRQAGSPGTTGIEVTPLGPRAGPGNRAQISAELTRMLGLDVNLAAFEDLVDADPEIGPVAEAMKGVRPPRLSSNFEALVNGVAGQLLSLEVAIHLLNRLTLAYGLQAPDSPERARTFPGPEQLAGLEPEALREMGYSFAKARTIIGAARAVVDGEIDLEDLSGLDDAEATSRLTGLWGIGRWTAEYTLLRGDGRLNVFPGDDIGAQNNLRARLGIESKLDYDRVQELVAGWQPYAGLVYFHLLLDSLSRAGTLDSRQS